MAKKDEKIRVNACMFIDKFDNSFNINVSESTVLMLNFTNAIWFKEWKNEELRDKYMNWALKHMDQNTVVKQLEKRLNIEDQKEMALKAALLFANSLEASDAEKISSSDKIMQAFADNLENTKKINGKPMNVYIAEAYAKIANPTSEQGNI